MTLSVQLITRIDELSSDDIRRWNDLAPNPFLRWEWLGTWASAYGKSDSLYVLRIQRGDETIGFAPWILEKRIGTGRTIEFLGSGKVCSDHLTVLIPPGDRADCCAALANWLAETATINPHGVDRSLVWEAIEWVGVDQEDKTMNGLVDCLRQSGLSVEQTEAMGCYAIELPNEWEDYIRLRSKSGRREIRQSMKNIDSGLIVLHTVESESELDSVWDQFVDLHQRRRHAEGTTGCFDHPPFGEFLRAAASEMLNSGLLKLVIATADGKPVAAQFALDDPTGWYFYQSGMDPDASALRPGLSVFCHSIRSSIQSGRKKFDMLRGDEPYKQRWRAELQPAQEIRVCSPRVTAQIRNQAYNAGAFLRNIVKSGFGFGEPQTR